MQKKIIFLYFAATGTICVYALCIGKNKFIFLFDTRFVKPILYSLCLGAEPLQRFKKIMNWLLCVLTAGAAALVGRRGRHTEGHHAKESYNNNQRASEEEKKLTIGLIV